MTEKPPVAELHPGDIVISHDDFALMLIVDKEGWPVEWMWLASGGHALMSQVGKGAIKYLFESRAILRPDGRVDLCDCDRSSSGWNSQALAWFRDADARSSHLLQQQMREPNGSR